MRRGIAALALVLGLTGAGGAQETAPAPAPATPEQGTLALTLQDAVALARRNNPGLRITEETRQRAEDRVREARAQRLPQVNLSGTYSFQGPVQEFTIPGEAGQPPQTVKLNRSTSRQIGASATLATDLAGRIRSQQRIARLGTDAAESDVRANENDLLFTVTEGYAAVLRAAEIVRVRQEAVGAAREQLRVAQAQFNAGVVPQFDVLRASVQVENLRQDQIASENGRETAEARLISILNIDPSTNLKLAPLTPPPAEGAPAPPAEGAAAAPAPVAPRRPQAAPGALPEPTPEPPILGEEVSPELSPMLEEAYRQRPEIVSAQQLVEQAKERVRFERRAGSPDLNLSARVNHNPDVTGFAADKTTYGADATLTFPLFTGGLIRSRVRGAQNEADIARARLEQVRQEVALDVRTALLNLREAERRRETTVANVGQAREALRIARVRYQAGVSTTVEVTDAEVALTQAQTNQVNAEYDVIVAQAALHRATGRREA